MEAVVILLIVLGIAGLLIVHILFVERYFEAQYAQKKSLKKDGMGAILHTCFVIGDSIVFVVIFNNLGQIAKESPWLLLAIGMAIIVLTTIGYRMLYLWWAKDKDLVEEDMNF